jgi:hypothetical protein
LIVFNAPKEVPGPVLLGLEDGDDDGIPRIEVVSDRDGGVVVSMVRGDRPYIICGWDFSSCNEL